MARIELPQILLLGGVAFVGAAAGLFGPGALAWTSGLLRSIAPRPPAVPPPPGGGGGGGGGTSPPAGGCAFCNVPFIDGVQYVAREGSGFIVVVGGNIAFRSPDQTQAECWYSRYFCPERWR